MASSSILGRSWAGDGHRSATILYSIHFTQHRCGRLDDACSTSMFGLLSKECFTKLLQILFLCTMAICTILVHNGLGRHIYYLSPEDIAQVLKWNWIVQPFGIMVLPFAKTSVSLLLLRLLGPKTKWQKWLIYLNIALMMFIFTLASILSFVQCNPPRALWEAVPGATCWDPSIQADYATFGSAYSAFADFFLALLPITILWNLKMSPLKKFSLCILLSVGVL